MLSREEYVEQAYFFGTLSDRICQAMPSQEVLFSIREEVLATTKLSMAIDYLGSELRHSGGFAPAMVRLKHYFTPFQAFVIGETESERGRLEMVAALEILRREAEYRAAGATPQGIFLFQFESISRNRLGYDRGLEAVSQDPIFDDAWREWILTVRRQVGLVDLADLIYVRSEYYWKDRQEPDASTSPRAAVLFGNKEGRIALANRQKDPVLLFAALQRQLGYPVVPRPLPADENRQQIPQLLRRLEKLEQRVKLVEEEQRGGIEIERYFKRPDEPASENQAGPP